MGVCKPHIPPGCLLPPKKVSPRNSPAKAKLKPRRVAILPPLQLKVSPELRYDHSATSPIDNSLGGSSSTSDSRLRGARPIAEIERSGGIWSQGVSRPFVSRCSAVVLAGG